MKIILLIILPTISYAQHYKLNELFERSATNTASCDSLIQFCLEEKNPQQIAYLGAGLMLKSKHLKNLKYFKKGKKKLEEIIEKNPSFVEFRWIRYCIQTNTPKILNYKQHLSIDKAIIQQNGNSNQKNILKLYD